MKITGELQISTDSIFALLREVPLKDMTDQTNAIFAGLLTQAGLYESSDDKIKEKANFLQSASLELVETGRTSWSIVNISLEIEKLIETKKAALATFKAIALIAGIDVK